MEMSSELFWGGGPYNQQEGSHQQLGDSWVERQPEDAAGLVSPTGPHLVQQDERVSSSRSPAPGGGNEASQLVTGDRPPGGWRQ